MVSMHTRINESYAKAFAAIAKANHRSVDDELRHCIYFAVDSSVLDDPIDCSILDQQRDALGTCARCGRHGPRREFFSIRDADKVRHVFCLECVTPRLPLMVFNR